MRDRKSHPSNWQFDETPSEPIWPVHISICLFGAILSGIVLWVCHGEASAWYGRRETWLAGTGLFVAILMIAAQQIPPQKMRRSVLLAIVLSLCANTAIVIGMACTEVFSVPVDRHRIVARPEQPKSDVVAPAYVMRPIKRHHDSRIDVFPPVDRSPSAPVPTVVQKESFQLPFEPSDRIARPVTSLPSESDFADKAPAGLPLRSSVSMPVGEASAPNRIRRVAALSLPSTSKARVLRSPGALSVGSMPSPSKIAIHRSVAPVDEFERGTGASVIRPTLEPSPLRTDVDTGLTRNEPHPVLVKRDLPRKLDTSRSAKKKNSSRVVVGVRKRTVQPTRTTIDKLSDADANARSTSEPNRGAMPTVGPFNLAAAAPIERTTVARSVTLSNASQLGTVVGRRRRLPDLSSLTMTRRARTIVTASGSIASNGNESSLPPLAPASAASSIPKSPPSADLSEVNRSISDKQGWKNRLKLVRHVRASVDGSRSGLVPTAVATDAFAHRLKRKSLIQKQGALPTGVEEAIELGLAYLSRQQATNGRWQLEAATRHAEPDPQPTLRSDTAATGLALLSYLGAGYHHLDGDYAAVVDAGLQFLIDNQAANGNLYIRSDPISDSCMALYSHGIAALALCEAYGMTQDPRIRDAAQRSIDFVTAAQNQRLGGWRYAPGIEADTSVSGWMVMALKSGELSQLSVSEATYANAIKWLDRAQASTTEPYKYRYNPLAPDTSSQRHGRRPTHVMTSVGLLMRIYLGSHRDDRSMQLGGGYLAEHLPQLGADGTTKRDTYYWYYATQVMFQLGGDHWQRWNRRLQPMLVREQVRVGPLAGSWDPFAPVPDRWATHAGRLYVTTLNLLSLEVPYRHLPIYANLPR